MPTARVAAVVVDCAESRPVAGFYVAAMGGQITKQDRGSTWVTFGGTLVIFREVPDHRPPTWPETDIPMQVHLDFFVDDLHAAEAELQRLGATTVGYQAHDNLRVMRDPAGHLFCIGA